MSKLLFTFLCLCSASVMAESEPPNAAEKIEDQALGVLDESRAYVSRGFVDMVKDIDRFFGSERNFQESNDSVLQLNVTRVTGYGGNRQVVLSGRANVHLPNTEKRLHLLIESDPDKNLTTDARPGQAALTQSKQTPSSYAAAVRYEKPQDNRWHFSVDGGIQLQGLGSHLFARTRAAYSAKFDDWDMNFSETPFWFNNLGLGNGTQLDFDHQLSEPLLFRASSYATWLHDRQNFDLRQDLSLFQKLNERTAMLYQASALGVSQPQWHSSDYVLTVQCRYRLHQQWMYFEISPQMHYPQARAYHPSPSLTMRLEMLFDALR